MKNLTVDSSYTCTFACSGVHCMGTCRVINCHWNEICDEAIQFMMPRGVSEVIDSSFSNAGNKVSSNIMLWLLYSTNYALIPSPNSPDRLKWLIVRLYNLMGAPYFRAPSEYHSKPSVHFVLILPTIVGFVYDTVVGRSKSRTHVSPMWTSVIGKISGIDTHLEKLIVTLKTLLALLL